ncbi:carbon storage regulator [Bacillus sp. B-jedd]|uniref:carbon storage regulator n=1 Tax=Bacillus sp. B-jedd TaxID=1476857 RepID=UPI0005156D96|nr:carbon storage regulator [Bacillus sp. B-jedd]CEG25896.1 hypothetical protein BN1002_00714 [Bacillus sp. B-jedd]
MLIIGREIGQAVIIGGNVKVTAIQFASKLKLAIEAPDDIPIDRVKPDVVKKLRKNYKIIGDTIQIGDSIKVTILQTETKSLRFAIDAPKEVAIYREELLENKASFNQQPAQIS